METTLIIEFNKRWDSFINMFKSRLIRLSEKKILTYPNAKLALSELKLTWMSMSDLEGKWLESVFNEDSKKGQLVKRILTDDMQIDAINKSTEISQILNLGVPLAGGIVGFGLAKICGWVNPWAIASATIAPIVVLYPSMQAYSKSYTRSVYESIITGYVGQLDRYKTSVISVLES